MAGYVLGGLILAIIAIVLIRTVTFKTEAAPSGTKPIKPQENLAYAEKLAEALQFKTVASMDYAQLDTEEYVRFQNFLEKSFPLVHKNFILTKINVHGLVYHIKGTDEGLEPVLFLAHYDVVPAELPELWTYPPFSGVIADGRVHGRGALDDKNEVMALMQTAEILLEEGYVFKRSLYFAFGQDEETGGANGAIKIAEYFNENRIRFDAVYDEGGVVITDAIKGVKSPIALIGVAEKGFNNIKLTVKAKGGHSSMPPKHSALGDIASIATRIENSAMKPILTPPVLTLLKNICSEMGFAVKMAVSNLWLFKPLLLKILSASPSTNAMIRTTFAVTMAKGSDAPNVLPQSAELIVNSRVLPGNTSKDAVEFIRTACRDIPAQIEGLLLEEASPISEMSGRGYDKLIDTIKRVYPNAIPSPYLVMGGTDARKYYSVSNHVYRFMPALIDSADQASMHAANESITIENYSRMIMFYEMLIKNYDE